MTSRDWCISHIPRFTTTEATRFEHDLRKKWNRNVNPKTAQHDRPSRRLKNVPAWLEARTATENTTIL